MIRNNSMTIFWPSILVSLFSLSFFDSGIVLFVSASNSFAPGFHSGNKDFAKLYPHTIDQDDATILDRNDYFDRINAKNHRQIAVINQDDVGDVNVAESQRKIMISDPGDSKQNSYVAYQISTTTSPKQLEIASETPTISLNRNVTTRSPIAMDRINQSKQFSRLQNDQSAFFDRKKLPINRSVSSDHLDFSNSREENRSSSSPSLLSQYYNQDLASMTAVLNRHHPRTMPMLNSAAATSRKTSSIVEYTDLNRKFDINKNNNNEDGVISDKVNNNNYVNHPENYHHHFLNPQHHHHHRLHQHNSESVNEKSNDAEYTRPSAINSDHYNVDDEKDDVVVTDDVDDERDDNEGNDYVDHDDDDDGVYVANGWTKHASVESNRRSSNGYYQSRYRSIVDPVHPRTFTVDPKSSILYRIHSSPSSSSHKFLRRHHNSRSSAPMMASSSSSASFLPLSSSPHSIPHTYSYLPHSYEAVGTHHHISLPEKSGTWLGSGLAAGILIGAIPFGIMMASMWPTLFTGTMPIVNTAAVGRRRKRRSLQSSPSIVLKNLFESKPIVNNRWATMFRRSFLDLIDQFNKEGIFDENLTAATSYSMIDQRNPQNNSDYNEFSTPTIIIDKFFPSSSTTNGNTDLLKAMNEIRLLKTVGRYIFAIVNEPNQCVREMVCTILADGRLSKSTSWQKTLYTLIKWYILI